MTDTTYKGWANQETWAANLWLNNSQEVYEGLNRIVRGVVSEDTSHQEISIIFALYADRNLSERAKFEIGDFTVVDWLAIGLMWIDEMEL